jgi:hypothetical protein
VQKIMYITDVMKPRSNAKRMPKLVFIKPF